MDDDWAARLPFFFFGTLMDADVLGRVLGREILASELTPAMLWGHRRYAVADKVYPVVRQERACHVPGLVFRPRGIDERLRIDHFESEEYEARPRRVQIGTKLTNALVYLDLEGVFELTTARWCLEAFRAGPKAAYLLQCDGWMSDYRPLIPKAAPRQRPAWQMPRPVTTSG